MEIIYMRVRVECWAESFTSLVLFPRLTPQVNTYHLSMWLNTGCSTYRFFNIGVLKNKRVIIEWEGRVYITINNKLPRVCEVTLTDTFKKQW